MRDGEFAKCPEPKSTFRKRKRLQLLWLQCCVCPDCGELIDPRTPMLEDLAASLDHVTPRSAGGTNDPANFLVRHRKCNKAKGDRPRSENDEWWLAFVEERRPLLPIDPLKRLSDIYRILDGARS